VLISRFCFGESDCGTRFLLFFVRVPSFCCVWFRVFLGGRGGRTAPIENKARVARLKLGCSNFSDANHNIYSQ
jgi:hypothetical protein